ncbi:MAG: hypothetical protein ABIA93_00705 [Candidatus Woesearchaeota archaeon]
MTESSKLYPEDDTVIHSMWQLYPFFDPGLPFLRSQEFAKAKERGFVYLVREFLANDRVITGRDFNRDIHIDYLNFNVPEHAELAEAQVLDHINTGVDTVNSLLHQHLPSLESVLRLTTIPNGTRLMDLLGQAEKHMLHAQTTSTLTEATSLYKLAYEPVRAFGLGYIIMSVEDCNRASGSMYQWHPEISERLNLSESSSLSDKPPFTHEWTNHAGIRIMGWEDQPYKSRSKLGRILETTDYGSTLVKLFNNVQYPQELEDYLGLELVVPDEMSRQHLVDFFRTNVVGISGLKGYAELKTGQARPNSSSSQAFGLTKFVVSPVSEPRQWRFPIGDRRQPTEVQILTYDDYLRRQDIPEATHEAYRRRRFINVFPAWFPKTFYEDSVKDHMQKH